jgi:exodeoxyribonuclease V alpha subunit
MMPSNTQISEAPILRLEGAVERVTFHSEESGYSVLRLKTKGNRDLVTVVGFVSVITPGENIESFGEWIQTKEYGRQFKAKSIRTVAPSTLEGIEKYLGSGMVKGIGPHFAKKLVKSFGFEVFDVIEQSPEKLRSVEGIGPKRIDKITSAWKDQKVIRSIMVFLQGHGVSTSKAVRIFKTYGEESVERVRANPYQLARDIHGIGFKSADVIAEKLGIAKNSIIRARAGVSYVLMERVQRGHCAYPEADLLVEASKLLEIEEETLRQAITAEIGEGHLVRESIEDQRCLYPASIHHCEGEIAQLLKLICQAPLPWQKIDTEKAIPWVEKQVSLKLAPLQKMAVATAVSSKVTIITGGPGTGKSTLTKSILTILKAKNIQMALCSPTGRAAKRLSECTGMEAKTIHRTLGFDPKKGGFTHDRDRPLPIDLLLIDEASMVDVQLMYSLLKAVPQKAAIIIIGDVDQLPSVGPGFVLADLIDSATIATVKLTEVFRQAAQSKIIQAAHRINAGEFPDLEHREGSDFFFITSDDPDATVPKIVDLVKNRIPQKFGTNAIRDVQVLCPMLRGTLGARNLNIELQKALNPEPKAKVDRFGYTFAVGDKVMVLQNDYDKEVFNGDMGFIREIDLEEQECLIDFDEKEVLFEFGELDILQPAYTVSIHKSQGSEYPVVVIPIVTQHYMMLRKNLVYTGITRGKRLVVLIGQKKALAIAIKTSAKDKRWTNLKKKLQAAID